MKKEIEYSGLEVAIIGLSCRVPGATNIDEFWDNLVHNSGTISFFSKSELEEAGLSSEVYNNPKFIPAKGILPGLENFDADFFKYTARDASNMDPQIRIMHEEVYHALEDAGYASEKNKDSIGVFIGAANNFLWELKTNKETVENGWLYLSTLQLNDKDFISSRIAYSLDLRGPSAAVHTACSTSLYAIDLAYRHIITGACPVAVAGGIGITLPNINGYNTSVAGSYSSDGYCRPFDKDASGTVASNGAAVVVLKSLDEAIRDGDRIYAVIKGTACNNDGSRKVGYTAPSVEGQAEVIKRALRMAQVPAKSVSYVETHGTATKIGDPIELAALNKGYGNGVSNTIGVGSLKSNIGHIDTGAGAAAVVKTALSLHNKLIPATLHFKDLNPFIEMEQSPFYVVAENTPLVNKSVPNSDRYYPLRAGVSAFGIGGTNVHMILEEAPDSEPSGEGKEWNTFCISANSEAALKRLKIEYIKYLKKNTFSINPCDLAWSLQTRKRKMKQRFSVAYDSIEHLIESLEKNVNEIPNIGHEYVANKDDANVYFLFPGHGSQYAGMSKDLYFTEPIFREEMDQCFSIIQNKYNLDMKSVLFEASEDDKSLLLHADFAQLSLFIVEYCVAKMLIKLGIKPAGMIGHSLGEYVAACMSEVFTLEDGISAIMRRGQLMNEIPQGAMISVNASADVVEGLLVEGVSIAAINTHSKCTISGRISEMGKVIENLKENGIQFISIESNHAAHSILMEPVREPLVKIFENIDLKSPKIPYVSNLTGTWITEEEATNASYYGKHVRECVKFAHGIDTIMTDNKAVLIEVGPKKVLSAFAIQTAINHPIGVMNILPDQMEQQRDSQYIANRLGELWDYGVNIDWKKFYWEQKRKFVKLPYYPFEQTIFKIGNVDMDELIGLSNRIKSNISKEQLSESASVEHLDVALDEIVWRKSNIQKKKQSKAPGTILAITDQTRTMMSLRKSMRFWRWLIASVDQSYSFKGNRPSLIRSANEADMEQLFADLQKHALLPDSILIAESAVQNVKDELRVLLKKLSTISSNYNPEIIILSPVNSRKDYKDFIDEINCIKAEFKVDNVFLIGLKSALKLSWVKKQWIKILQSEISISEREAIAVLYDGENQYIPEYKSIEDIGRAITGVIPSEIVCISNKANRTDCIAFCNELIKITGQKIHLLEYTFEESILEEIVQDETIDNNSKLIFEPLIIGTNLFELQQCVSERLNEIACDGCFVWNKFRYSDDNLESNELEVMKYIINTLHDWSSTYNKNIMIVSGIPQEKEWTLNSTKYFMQQKREVVGRKTQKLFVTNLEEISLRCLAKTVKQMYQMKLPTVIIGSNKHSSVSLVKLEDVSTLQENFAGEKEKIMSSLHEIWKTLFGRNDINIDSDFFRLGGDSFKIMQISEDIEKLGYKITINEVYEYPTIRTLAEYLSNKLNQASKKFNTIHEFEEEIRKQFECNCYMRHLLDDEFVYLLCIDCDKKQKKKIEKFLTQIDMPQEIAPTYILTKDEVEKLGGEYTLIKMISTGILKESDNIFWQSIDAKLTRANESLHKAILRQPIESSYRIGTTQQMFLKGDSRLNLYSIDFNEAIDVELMKEAICDILGRNGLLHSILGKKGSQYQWIEYIPPVNVDIELFDISRYTERFQKSIVSEIIDKTWNNMTKIMGVLMYRLLLIKWSEKHYELLFVFDHSIVDMISGQVIRRQINSRYEELKTGSRKASSKSIGYDYYLDFVKRGPIGVSADEIVEKLDLKNIYKAKVSLGKYFLQEFTEMKKIQLNVDLTVFGMEEIDEQNTFNIALQVFAKTVARVLKVNELPFDLIYTNRTYGEMTFSDMVGPTVDAVSFLVSVNDKNPTHISRKVTENMKYCVDNNMSFNNIEWSLPAIWKWRKIVKYMGSSPEVMGGQVLLNYAGQVEEEYDKIFERSIDLLDEEHQNKFDFGNFYVISKSSGNNLQFIIFTKVVSDVSIVEESFDKVIDELKEYYKENSDELCITG